MASRSVFPIAGAYKMPYGVTLLAGSFIDAGSSDPSTIIGEGFTVTHAATGKWTVTLDETFPFLIAGFCQTNVGGDFDLSTYIRQGDADDLIEGAISSFTIVQNVNGTPSENSGRVISFLLVLANSTLAKNRSS